MKIDARRAPGTRSIDATGTFDATVAAGPLALMDLHGPVTPTPATSGSIRRCCGSPRVPARPRACAWPRGA
jgi:hypothetical protein